VASIDPLLLHQIKSKLQYTLSFSDYCSAWMRGLRRIWELPNTFRS